MDDYRALIRFQTARAEGLRRAARTYRQVHAAAAGRPGPKVVVAALLRGAAERLDPTPRVAPRTPRPRSI